MKKLPTVALLGSVLLASTSTLYAADYGPLLSDPPPQAAEKQVKGMGIGALIGTLLAGPVGAVAGSGFGAVAGWSEGMEQAYQQQQGELKDLNQQRSHDKQQIEQLNTEVAELKQQSQQLQDNHPLKPLLKSLYLDIHYQTNSAVVEPHYYSRLAEMATRLQHLPQIHLKLKGYADHRGNPDLNLRLAKQRAEALASLLRSKGMDGDRICIEVAGEDGALSKNNNGLLPFDRRVEIRFQFKPQTQL